MDLPTGVVACAGVDHLLLVLDGAFPWSDPRVLAPQITADFTWPHVEPEGLLCLRKLDYAASASDRALASLNDAIILLNLSETTRRAEFWREFRVYWAHKSHEGGPRFASLVKLGKDPREIVYHWDRAGNLVTLADNHASLKSWLLNSGRNVGDKQIFKTSLLWLDFPLMPSEYPELGQDLLKHLPEGTIDPYIIPGSPLPLLIGAQTETGPVFVGAVLCGAKKKDLIRGFRHIEKVPRTHITRSYAARALQRCKVERVDADWVHGRDHNSEQSVLRIKRIAIVGCGALGGAVARLLAQAGISQFILVDPDSLASHNTSRHILGQRFLGWNKARAVAHMLGEDFPHIKEARAIQTRFEMISAKDLNALAKCDLILSAGLDLRVDAELDRWRCALEVSPVHLSTWTEEYAVAGHAVALFGKNSFLSQVGSNGVPAFFVTDWPDGSTTHIEAGCGNAFQPHGAADLSAVTMLAAQLALDILLGQRTSSCRRLWLGDRDMVAAKGGSCRPGFVGSHQRYEFPW